MRVKLLSWLMVIVLLAELSGVVRFPGVVQAQGHGEAYAGAPVSASAVYVGENRTLQGNWAGSFGTDGYVLPYYAAAASNGRDAVQPANAASAPSYLSGYSPYGTTYWVIQNPAADVRALEPPAGFSRKSMTVYGGDASEQTFVLTDNDPHLFTIYTTDFGQADTVKERFELFDLNGALLASRVVESIQNGVYVMFEVTGSFKLKATKLAGYAAYYEGFFFDEAVANGLSGLQASYTAPRAAHLSWNTANPQLGVQIERKKEGEPDFKPVATVAAGIAQYTDASGLDASSVYHYRLRNMDSHRLSRPTAAAEVTVPAYSFTAVQFGAEGYSLAKPGQEVVLEAVLTDGEGQALPGKPIRFELSGEHVGAYIDAAMGISVTDGDGRAVLAYTSAYSGEYGVKALFDYDDSAMLVQSESTVSLTVYEEPWQAPPVILRVSDAVSPDTLVSVNGYGLTGASLEVKAAPSAGIAAAVPPAGAASLVLEQADERNGYYVTARLPSSLEPGVYDLWVKNDWGWSRPFKLNGARPLFISDDEAYEGLEIEVSGRNFALSEFGGTDDAMIRLNDGAGGEYPQLITALTPYSMSFAVGSLPAGDYAVEVSNNGGTDWVPLDNGQRLSIVTAGDNPLGLNAAWAREFAWSNVVNVADYGAAGHDTADDTQAVGDAVQAAKQQGGGMVYFPSGSYYLSHVDLPAGIVLLGEDEGTTFLYHNGGNANFIRSSGDGKTAGRQGVARLSLRLANPDMRPDAFMWFGNDWGPAVTDKTLRTAESILIYRVNIDYPITPQPAGSGRGQGAVFIIHQQLLFEQCSFKGYYASAETAYVSYYTSHRNNRFEFARGRVSTFAQYAFMENNELVGHPEILDDAHGLFGRNDLHMADNRVAHIGPTSAALNDGEALCVEMPTAFLNEGDVLGAAESSITVAPHSPLAASYPLRYSYLAVVIVDGKGLGQLRKVTGISGNTLQVEKDWQVVPDGSSKFTLIAPNDNVTFYRNTVVDSAKGIWMYGNVIDGVAADNVSTDSEGIYVFTSQVTEQKRMTPGYFISVRGNVVEGVSRRSGHAGIYVNSQRTGVQGRYYAVSAYGIDIKDNRVVGVPEAVPVRNTESPAESGIVSWSALLSSDANPSNEAGDNTNIVVENNVMSRLNRGISLSLGDYGHVMKGNAFEQVDHEWSYTGQPVHTLYLPDAYTDNRAPYWPAGGSLEVQWTGTGAVLSWDPAADNDADLRYRIYHNGLLAAAVSSGETGYALEGVPEPGEHSFGVVAEDAAGNRSAVLSAVSVRPVL